MAIKERVNDDIKNAMRARDSKKLGVLRLISSAFKQIEVDERRVVEDDVEIIAILDKLLKQRKESIAQFTTAKRDDLVAQEQYEIDIIVQYMPEPLSEADILAIVVETISELSASNIADIGKVMAKLKPILQGKADLSKVSLLVKSKLS